MTAPDFCVLDGNPAGGIVPRRPDGACEDMGGLAFQDDLEYTPNPNEEASAKDFKQHSTLIQRLCRMMPMVVVEFVADSTPTVASFVCGNDRLVAGDILISYTGTGRYTITLPSSTLPSANRSPYAYLVSNIGSALWTARATQSGNTVTVTTHFNTGLADAGDLVCVEIYGGA
jgi:hypothetical protein